MSKWPMVPLGEIVTQDTEATPVSADREYPNLGIYSFGRGLFEKQPISGTSTSATSLYRVKAGQFIYSRLFAFEGAYGLVGDELDGHYVSNEYPHFNCHPERVLPEYLATYFRASSTWERAATLTTGMGDRRRRIKPEQLIKLEIPLPPLPEQKKIVEWTDAVADRAGEVTALRNKSNQAQSALRSAVISRVLDGLHFDGTLADFLDGKPRNGWSAKCDGADGGVPILSLAAVTGFNYREDQFKRTSEATDPDGHYWLKRGDLLITRSNTPQLVGHAAIYSGDPSPCIYPDLMMRIPLDQDRCEPKFAHYVLQSRIVREYIRLKAKGTSPTMKKISQGTVIAIPFPTHLTLQEQQRVVTTLDTVLNAADELVGLSESASRLIDNLVPSTLNEVFADMESSV